VILLLGALWLLEGRDTLLQVGYTLGQLG
jgi:hypothetical protein